MSFITIRNPHSGYYARQLGKSGILATAKRIKRIEKEMQKGVNPLASCKSITDLEYEMELYHLIENKGKVKIKEEEFVKYNTKAVLMGENILLLDNENKVIEDITFLKGQIVEVEELSKTIRINEHKSSCKELLWAKIKSDKREGYIDANILYEVKVNENNQYLKFKNNVVSIVQTKSLVTKSKVIIDSILDITSVCGEYNPIVFIDSSSNYFGTLKNVASKYQNENEEFYTFYNDDDDLFYTKD
jgi:hypothetical protein